MKHLLIILISLLLLSSPVIGQETSVLYQYETSTGIKWKTLGVGQVQPKYEGEITYGEPNGKGIETFPNGEKYVGEFKDGKYDGQGTWTSTEGEKYVGEFKDNKRNGQGTFTFHSGDKYVGEWKDEKQHGLGTYIWSDGRKYVGEYKDGEKWNGKFFDRNRNIPYKYVNGKKIYP